MTPPKTTKAGKPDSQSQPSKDLQSMTKIDSELVRQLAAVLDDTGLTEIEYELDGLRIRVARTARDTLVTAGPTTSLALNPNPPSAPMDPASNPGTVKAPMVGVAYLLPEPSAPPFVTIGDDVKVGQTVGLIEAMKTFNPVKSTKAGKVTSIIVENGAPVEYGEPLVIIE